MTVLATIDADEDDVDQGEDPEDPEPVWLILDELSGEALLPVNMPRAFQVAGLPVAGLALEKAEDTDEFRTVSLVDIHRIEPDLEPELIAFTREVQVLSPDNGDEWLIRAADIGFITPRHLPKRLREAGLAVEGLYVQQYESGDRRRTGCHRTGPGRAGAAGDRRYARSGRVARFQRLDFAGE